MQKIAAVANLVCYYCIALPMGVTLMFYAKLRILGNAFIFIVCSLLLDTLDTFDDGDFNEV